MAALAAAVAAPGCQRLTGLRTDGSSACEERGERWGRHSSRGEVTGFSESNSGGK